MAVALPPPPPPQAAIVITGKALPEPAAERAYSVTRISRQEMDQAPRHDVEALLRQVAGVQLFRRSDARSGHPTSQGITLRALGGNASSRALLILDGVPQIDPFGGWVNWPAFDAQSVDEIRVVHGGGSVANGPGALAGTIEMVSRSDRGLSADAEVGSRSSFDARGRAGLAFAGGTLALSGQAQRSSGFVPVTSATRGPADEPAPYRNWGGGARWVAPIAADTEVQASISGFHDWRTRGTKFSANRTDGADASLRLVGRGQWQWSALGYAQWRDLRSSFASRTSATRVALQHSVPSTAIGGSFEVRPALVDGFELRLGADARTNRGESRELYSYVMGEATRRRAAGGESSSAGIFAEVSRERGPLLLTAGGRIDRWSVSDGHLRERSIADRATITDVDFTARNGWLPTARGGASVRIGEAVKLRSAAYLGWRMPTLNELFRPFRAGPDATAANALLRPERLRGVEAGIDYRQGAFSGSLTGFVNRLSNAIANVTLAEGPGVFPGVGFVGPGGVYRQRRNIDAVDVRGIEASAALVSGPWLARAGLSLTNARIAAGGAAASLDGLRPAQTPAVVVTAGAGWERDDTSLSIQLRRTGMQYEDDLNRLRLDPATTLDVQAAWRIASGLQLVARAENLTNTRVMAGLDSDGTVERATPRTVWFGVRLR